MVVAHRTDDLFAQAAKQDGEVLDVDSKSIKILNADGSVTALELGRRFGSAGGLTLPHSLTTGFKKGDKVKKGDIIAYNEGFFEPDYFNPKQVAWKAGVMATTAVMEAIYTLEDSSALSPELAEKLGTSVTKIKTVVVKFDQSVRNLVKVGDHVDLESILCTIEDAVTARADMFDEHSLDTLRLLSAMTPRAKTTGVVEKVEVFYHGDVDDMSESLQQLVAQADKERKALCRKLNEPVVTGSVDQSLRIDGNGLELDQVAIKIYITHNVGTGVGDKFVFGNQAKTVVGHVLEGVHETLSGTKIDAIFGFKSFLDRIILSPMIIGTTNTLLRIIGEMAAEIYFEEKQ